MSMQVGLLSKLIAILAAGCALPMHAQAHDKPSDGTGKVVAEEVELFEAMEQRQVEVKFIPLGSDRANMIVANKTLKPLKLRLPNTFAGVPVLGQFGGGQPGVGQGLGPGFGQGLGNGGGQFGVGPLGGGQLGAGGQPGQQGGGQALGGGFNQNQGGGGGGGNGFGLQNGGGRGLFRVEPGRPTKISVKTVCLEHGKPDPNPRMKYQLVPLAQASLNPEIEILCNQLAVGYVSQNVAQAAAWNLANGLTWDQLAKKNRRESNYTGNEKYFSSEELQQATRLTGHCRALANRYVANNSSADLAPQE